LPGHLCNYSCRRNGLRNNAAFLLRRRAKAREAEFGHGAVSVHILSRASNFSTCV
jgi:hypothetical protein